MHIFILFSLALILMLPPGANAQHSRLDTALGIEKIHPDLLHQMTAPPFVTRQPDAEHLHRVIVNLYPRHRAVHRRVDDLARLHPQVREAQDAVLQSRQRGTLTILNRYRNIYSFSALANREAIFELAAMADVEWIETVPIMQKMDQQSHALTSVDQVHVAGFTGRGVTIAIIDDGIDAAHPAFGGDTAWPNDKIIGGYDFADHDSDPRNDCRQQSHGTAVAGIAAGNGGGILGTAPDAQIVFLKIQSAQYCGYRLLNGDLIAALDWLLSERKRFGIDMISMSLGGQVFSSASVCNNAMLAMRQLIDLAHDAGLIIFAAAGNAAQPHAIAHPACMSNVISVGAVYDANLGPVRFSTCSDAVTSADRATCYSNSADFLNLLAPAHCATTASTTNGRETCFGGTSASAPFAAGIAATLLEAANVPLTNDRMRHLLISTGVVVFDDKSGLFIPRIDAQAAHDTLATVLPPPSEVPCTDCTWYTGTLSDTYDLDIQPDDTYYSSPPGIHNGWLAGPDQTNFDLYLLKWSGSSWTTVAESSAAGSEEFITYQGTAGYYAWRIISHAGGGSYHVWLQRP